MFRVQYYLRSPFYYYYLHDGSATYQTEMNLVNLKEKITDVSVPLCIYSSSSNNNNNNNNNNNKTICKAPIPQDL